MWLLAGAPCYEPGQGTRGGSITFPSLFLSIFHHIAIIFCGHAQSCRFWLRPVALARNLGFSAKELRDLERFVIDNQQRLLEALHEYFE
jgi:hypothetical protein